ncbi:hypothetical protein L1887_55208 [Cichorium endivia]|nr:hypothetical protein L1887_55208 [Cichorium endivia]
MCRRVSTRPGANVVVPPSPSLASVASAAVPAAVVLVLARACDCAASEPRRAASATAWQVPDESDGSGTLVMGEDELIAPTLQRERLPRCGSAESRTWIGGAGGHLRRCSCWRQAGQLEAGKIDAARGEFELCGCRSSRYASYNARGLKVCLALGCGAMVSNRRERVQ